MRRYFLLSLFLSVFVLTYGQSASAFDSLGLPQPTTASYLRYWYDDNTSVQTCSTNAETQTLDVSGLAGGLHTLHYQVVCVDSTFAPACSSMFIKNIAAPEAGVAASMRYWFDNDTTQTYTNAGAQILDVSGLFDGLHTLHYQTICSDSSFTPACSSIFLKQTILSDSLKAVRLRYWFDDATTIHTGTAGIQQLDLSELQFGLHTVHYQVVCSDSSLTTPCTAMFYISDGVLGQYQYWLNDNVAELTTVPVSSPVQTFQLLADLQVAATTIHSSRFHFEVVDEIPMIYSIDTLHLRFYDALYRQVEDSADFVNGQTSREIYPVSELLNKSGQVTFLTPQTDSIQWYSMTCLRGDTLAFWTSQQATLQVFAPSSAEAYKAKGSAASKDSLFVTTEAGTYYVAVHDVTGTAQQTTLSYRHRYAPHPCHITTQSINTAYGTTSGDTTVNYGDTITISALANSGYVFAYWNDRIQDNPRQVRVTQDSTFAAYFIPAEATPIPTGAEDTVVVEAHIDDADITWPVAENTDSCILTIVKESDSTLVYRLVFDAYGHIQGVYCAPSRGGHTAAVDLPPSGLSYSVPGLETNTCYDYSMTNANSDGTQTLYTGTFCTGAPSAIDETQVETTDSKFLQGGILLIRHNGHIYNAIGQEIK